MTSIKQRPEGYSRVQITLHWVIALLIAGQYLFKNAIATAWDTIRAGNNFAFDPLVMAHVAGGSLILLLVIWRVIVRVRRGVPATPENEPAILKAISHIVHWAFYVVLIMMSLSGLAAWFGDVVFAAQVHNILKVVLLALIAMHVLAVPFHHVVLKNPIMKRMVKSHH